MMLRRSQAYPDLWERKRFTGPLDIRAPEDRPVVEQQNAPAAPIRSPLIDKALGDFGKAMHSGVVDEMKRSAKDVVDATSAYFRMSGVPTFAHDPVPPQLIKHALPVELLDPGEHTKQAVGHFVDVFEDSVKPMLREQVMRHLEGGAKGARRAEMSPGEAPGQVERSPALVRSLFSEGGEAGDAIDAARRSTLLYQAGLYQAGLYQAGSIRRGSIKRGSINPASATPRGKTRWNIYRNAMAMRAIRGRSNRSMSSVLVQLRAAQRWQNSLPSTVQLSHAPAGSYPPHRAPKNVNSEDPRYPWHPHWYRYDLDRSDDGSEFGTWRTKDSDYEWSKDGGKTWYKASPHGLDGSSSGGPPNKSDNPKGIIYRKTKTDLIS